MHRTTGRIAPRSDENEAIDQAIDEARDAQIKVRKQREMRLAGAHFERMGWGPLASPGARAQLAEALGVSEARVLLGLGFHAGYWADEARFGVEARVGSGLAGTIGAIEAACSRGEELCSWSMLCWARPQTLLEWPGRKKKVRATRTLKRHLRVLEQAGEVVTLCVGNQRNVLMCHIPWMKRSGLDALSQLAEVARLGQWQPEARIQKIIGAARRLDALDTVAGRALLGKLLWDDGETSDARIEAAINLKLMRARNALLAWGHALRNTARAMGLASARSEAISQELYKKCPPPEAQECPPHIKNHTDLKNLTASEVPVVPPSIRAHTGVSFSPPFPPQHTGNPEVADCRARVSTWRERPLDEALRRLSVGAAMCATLLGVARVEAGEVREIKIMTDKAEVVVPLHPPAENPPPEAARTATARRVEPAQGPTPRRAVQGRWDQHTAPLRRADLEALAVELHAVCNGHAPPHEPLIRFERPTTRALLLGGVLFWTKTPLPLSQARSSILILYKKLGRPGAARMASILAECLEHLIVHHERLEDPARLMVRLAALADAERRVHRRLAAAHDESHENTVICKKSAERTSAPQPAPPPPSKLDTWVEDARELSASQFVPIAHADDLRTMYAWAHGAPLPGEQARAGCVSRKTLEDLDALRRVMGIARCWSFAPRDDLPEALTTALKTLVEVLNTARPDLRYAGEARAAHPVLRAMWSAWLLAAEAWREHTGDVQEAR